MPGALAELKVAARLAPEDAHMGYVYGVALHDTGNARAGVAQLLAVLKDHPVDIEVLQALAAYAREAGDAQAMQRYMARIQEISAAGP
jgi:predicted Zn-dependent protease